MTQDTTDFSQKQATACHSAGVSAVFLGSMTNTSTPPSHEATIELFVVALEDCSTDRSRRYWLRKRSAVLLPERRVAKCGWVRISRLSPVSVTFSEKNQRASYHNLQTCGSVWNCPVCASKVTERRRRVLSEAIEKSGLHPVMITFTQQHKLGDKLVQLRDVHLKALAKFKAGKSFAKFKQRIGWAADVRTLETTFSFEFGWHLHSHILMLLESPADIEVIAEYVAPRWARMVEAEGGYASVQHGVKVTAHDALAEYIAKFQDGDAIRKQYDPAGWSLAHEMTKQHVKQSRSKKGVTPFGLLALAAEFAPGTSEREYLADRWREYDAALFGRRQLVTSRNFFEVVPVSSWDDDEAIAAEADEVDRLLGCLNGSAWGYVHQAQANGELLAACADGQSASLWSFLQDIGIPAIVIAECRMAYRKLLSDGGLEDVS